MIYVTLVLDQQNCEIDRTETACENEAGKQFTIMSAKYSRFAVGTYRKVDNTLQIWAQNPRNKWGIPHNIPIE